MRPSGWLFLAQLAICVALGASASLYVHYLDPADSDFCGLQSGCEAIRQSGLSYFLGSKYVSLPLFGLVAFSALLGLSARVGRGAGAGGSGIASLWRRPELALFAASGLGAVLGLGLIAYQALALEAFCWLCLVVDSGAIVAGAAAFGLARSRLRSSEPPAGVLRLPALLAFAAAVVLAPMAWHAIKPPPKVPPAIEALYQPGKINVIEFADFECPFCRRLHALLDPLVDEAGERVHFQRLQRPLSQHVYAEHAARAALCAEAQGRGEPMADRLFAEKLDHEKIAAIAEQLRLDPGAFDACMGSEQTTRELERHVALLPDEDFVGLPTLYVGNQRFIGLPSPAALRDAFARAARPAPFAPSGPLYTAAVGVVLAAIAFFGRRR
jgi:protein-disulfide isomerase/uncharacterized membrane protein